MNGTFHLKLVNHTIRSVSGVTAVRYYGNICRRCYGNLKVGLRYIQYKANQPQFVTPTQLKISRYGIVVYESRMLTENNLPGMMRSLLIYMTFSLPVISFVGYCDLVLRNERNFSLDDWKKGTGLLVVILLCGLVYSKDQSKRMIKRLYFNRKEKKIYIEGYTGFCKPKIYGPYDPSIGSRRILTVQSKGSYITQEHLIFEGQPLTARQLSYEKLEKITEGMGALSSPFSILKNIEGHDMGNREFRIDVNGTDMKEKKLYKQLFRIHEEEEISDEKNKKKNRQFD